MAMKLTSEEDEIVGSIYMSGSPGPMIRLVEVAAFAADRKADLLNQKGLFKDATDFEKLAERLRKALEKF